MKIILFFSIIVLNFFNYGTYAQESKKANPQMSKSDYSEYDYYEQFRIARKIERVKKILEYSGDHHLTKVSHYNRDGFLEKIEAYGGNENPPCKFREIIVSNLSGRGDLNGTEVLYNCGVKFNQFPFFNVIPSDFYNLRFDENITEKVLYIFDSQNKLVEQIWVCPDCSSPNGTIQEKLRDQFDTVKFIYNGDKVVKVEYEDASYSEISYNEKGLKSKKHYFEKDGNSASYNIEIFEYEFYETEDTNEIDDGFIEFFERFKTAVLLNDRNSISQMTQWSEKNGGFLSIGARSQASFMNNVYELLFGKSDWKNTIGNITVDERITTEYGEIYLSKTDPKLFDFGDFEIVYILERTGNALVFKKINDEFKLVAMMYTGEGD